MHGLSFHLGKCILLSVNDAIVNRSRREGRGHHDLVLKHAGNLANGPFYCHGFITMEVKVTVAGLNGRRFRAAWEAEKERCEEALARELRSPRRPFGAAALLVIGICDNDDFLARDPPLLVKSQLLTLNDSDEPKWGQLLIDRGAYLIEPDPPPPRRQRVGASWDEVRARLQGKEQEIDGDDVKWVRLLDLFVAISAQKTNKNPGQKLVTYQKFLGLLEPSDCKRKNSQRPEREVSLFGLCGKQLRRCTSTRSANERHEGPCARFAHHEWMFVSPCSVDHKRNT